MLGPVAWTILILALAATASLVVLGVRHPILFRMGARNATRRPRQTATVVAGLMVGTAIISAALVTGESGGYAIRSLVLDVLGHIDETAEIDGFPYYPDVVMDAFLADPEVTGYFDAIAPNAVWSMAVEHPDSGLFEPRVSIIGYDPQRDAGFGPFELQGGGSTGGQRLQEGQVIINQELATSLDARVGDRLHATFTQPFDPLIPDLHWTNGTINASLDAGQDLPLLGDTTAQPVPSTHTIAVAEDARRITAVVGFDPRTAGMGPPTASLRLVLESPNGTTWSTPWSPPGDPTTPLWLNATATPTESLEGGDWTLHVHGNGAGIQYAGATVVLLPLYDLENLPDSFDFTSPKGFSPERFLEPQEASFTVAAITTGGRGDQFDFTNSMFLRLDETQRLLGREGQINALKFSNPGGIEDGAATTEEAFGRLNATLADVKQQYPDVASVQALKIRNVKQEFLEVADQTGEMMTGLMIFAGSLSILTGMLLIINIFTMLAEERRSDLGMARAVGMQRKDLTRMFLFEGSLYAVAAAAIGALVGLGLSYGLIQLVNAIFADVRPERAFPPIPFRATWEDVLVSFAAGALLTYATIFFASRRQARLNIVRAIRQIEEPETHGSRRAAFFGILLAAAGLSVAAFGWAVNQFTMIVVGPIVLALGLGMVLRRVIRRARLYPGLAILLFLYNSFTYFAITEYDNITEANIVGPLRGVVMTLAVVTIVVHMERSFALLGRLLMRLRRLRAVALPAISYPLHKKFRTGLTMMMFAIIILFIGFFSIFGALFELDPSRQSGGFDVEGRTTLQVDDLQEMDGGLLPAGLVTSMHHVVDYETMDLSLITVNGERTGQFGPPVHHVYGVDQEFVDAQEFRLLWRSPQYEDDQAAYNALLERDDAVIVAYPYSTNERNEDLSHEVGDPLQLHFGKRELQFTIIGIQEQYHFPGIFLPKERVETLFPESWDLWLFNVQEGSDPVEAAELIERNYRDAGMDAESVEALIAEEQESFSQILGTMKAFLGLGLIIGVLSLGIVTSRNVIERRQEIGMMRALGFTGSQVRRVFFIEVTMTVLLGAIIGVLCSLIVTYGLWYAVIRELQYPYIVPWGEIGLLILISYLVTLLATAAPIQRSARVPPAEALRYVE